MSDPSVKLALVLALIEIAHPPVARVERDMFVIRFAPDCMTHECRCGGRVELDMFVIRFAPDCMTHECRCGGRVELDACCRYGADVDLYEKERILARTREVQAVLTDGLRDPARWFADDEAEPDPEAPSGILTRTARLGPAEHGRCVFLGHSGRGCALHRAAVESAFDPAEIKPRVCRLYPLMLDGGVLGFSDDFTDYSCAGHAGPTVYQVMRPTLASVFGEGLVHRLDVIDGMLATGYDVRRRLRVS